MNVHIAIRLLGVWLQSGSHTKVVGLSESKCAKMRTEIPIEHASLQKGASGRSTTDRCHGSPYPLGGCVIARGSFHPYVLWSSGFYPALLVVDNLSRIEARLTDDRSGDFSAEIRNRSLRSTACCSSDGTCVPSVGEQMPQPWDIPKRLSVAKYATEGIIRMCVCERARLVSAQWTPRVWRGT